MERKFDLEDVCYKYERLASIIGIMQMLVAEVADVAGSPKNDIINALYEVELEMERNNERLRTIQQANPMCIQISEKALV